MLKTLSARQPAAGMGWDRCTARLVPGTAWGTRLPSCGDTFPRAQPWDGQTDLPSPTCFWLWELGWGSPAGGGRSCQQYGVRLEGIGPYLFGVVPREDAVPVELLQDILQLLGGVWGDKGHHTEQGAAEPPSLVAHQQDEFICWIYNDWCPPFLGRGHPCPAFPLLLQRGTARWVVHRCKAGWFLLLLPIGK